MASVRRSVNGVPTGTDFTIGISDGRAEHVIALRKESTYSGFIQALWPAVCVRLVLHLIACLEEGQTLHFGDIVVEDDAVTLPYQKLFSSNRPLRLRWSEVHVWSADGKFFVGKRDDKKVYGSASYIQSWDTHLIEHVVRGAFKKCVVKLSDYLRD